MTTRRVGGWLAGVAALVALAATAGAQAPPPPLRTLTVDGLGIVLAGPSGMSLYVYLNDREPGKSVCTGACEANWPPFRPAPADPAAQEPLSVISRLDSSKQYAYRGKPLYYCKTDKKPGDVTGHKFRDFWLVAQP